MTRNIIIDTDPGVDDALAIFYALRAQSLPVLGLTTVYGNAPVTTCTDNALNLLAAAGYDAIPVAMGADRPLVQAFHGGAAFVHGDDALGNLHLPAPTQRPLDQHAALFIIDRVRRHPADITLVAIGPLTNIALALRLAPDIAPKIREIVLMGGNAFVHGNVTPAAEANIWNDPEAADIVFSADCPITMLGLDVTEQLKITAAQMDGIAAYDNRRAQFMARAWGMYRQFHITRHAEDCIYSHDSSTITYLLQPDLFTFVQHPVRVELAGLGRGKTWPSLSRADDEGAWAKRRAVNIAVGVQASAAVDLELRYLMMGDDDER